MDGNRDENIGLCLRTEEHNLHLFLFTPLQFSCFRLSSFPEPPVCSFSLESYSPESIFYDSEVSTSPNLIMSVFLAVNLKRLFITYSRYK